MFYIHGDPVPRARLEANGFRRRHPRCAGRQPRFRERDLGLISIAAAGGKDGAGAEREVDGAFGVAFEKRDLRVKENVRCELACVAAMESESAALIEQPLRLAQLSQSQVRVRLQIERRSKSAPA